MASSSPTPDYSRGLCSGQIRTGSSFRYNGEPMCGNRCHQKLISRCENKLTLELLNFPGGQYCELHKRSQTIQQIQVILTEQRQKRTH
jgi:hypothetical protein